MLSFAVNHLVSGLNPWGFKAVNLVIHLLTSITIYALLYLLLSTPRFTTFPYAHWLPITITAAWLISPINLTTVLYIVQRMTGLASLFILLGITAYTWGRSRQLQNRSGTLPIVFSLLFFAPLATLSKENGILLLPCLLLVESLFFHFRRASGNLNYPLIILFTLIIGVPVVSLTGYLLLHPEIIINGYTQREFSLEQRLLTESRILLLYIRLILSPDIQLLGMFHDDIVLSQGLFDPPTTLLSIIALVSLLILAITTWKKIPLVSFGILLFFMMHTMESTVIALELIHEHRNYIASLGILIAAFGALFQAISSKHSSHILVIVCCLFLALTGFTTYVRSTSWGGSLTHAIDEARNHPQSPRANLLACNMLLAWPQKITRNLFDSVLITVSVPVSSIHTMQ